LLGFYILKGTDDDDNDNDDNGDDDYGKCYTCNLLPGMHFLFIRREVQSRGAWTFAAADFGVCN
jgi:hypothetical protein